MSNNRNTTNPEIIASIEALLKNINDNEAIAKLQNIDVFSFRSETLTKNLPLLCYACLSTNIPLTFVLLTKFKTNHTKADLKLAYYYACSDDEKENHLIVSLLQKYNIPLPTGKRTQFFSADDRELHGLSLIFAATCNGHTEIVKKLLKGISEKEINAPNNPNKYTLLHGAAEFNQIECAKLLIAANANLNIQDKFERTPLFSALVKKNYDFAELLINHNADLTLPDNESQNVLMYICDQIDHDSKRLELVKLILSKIDKKNRVKYINQRGPGKKTALYYAAFRALGSQNNEITKLLVENGADVNCVIQDGLTIFNYVCDSSKGFELAKLFIAHNANVNHINGSGESCLHSPCVNQNAALVKLLLENGTKITRRDFKYFHNLIDRGNYNILKLLLEHDNNSRKQDSTENEITVNVFNGLKINTGNSSQSKDVAPYLERWTHFCMVYKSKYFTEHNKTHLLQLLIYKHEKLFLTFAAYGKKDYFTDVVFLKKILELQDIATIKNCGDQMLIYAILSHGKDNISFLLENGASFSRALQLACEEGNKENLKFTVLKIATLTTQRPLGSLLEMDKVPDVKAKYAAMIDAILAREERNNSNGAPLSSNEIIDNSGISQQHEKDEKPVEVSVEVNDVSVDPLTSEPVIVDTKPVNNLSATPIVIDPKDNIKVLKLAFANLIDENAITWEDQQSVRTYIIQFQVNETIHKNLLQYLRKNFAKMHVTLTVINDQEIHVIVSTDQQINLSDNMKERIFKFVSKQQKEMNKQEAVDEHHDETTNNHPLETNGSENANTASPTANKESNSFSFLTEDEVMNSEAIKRFIFAVTQIESRQPLTIEPKKKCNWSITCKLNQYGVGSKAFFTAFVNAIHPIAKQFDVPKNEIKIILSLNNANIQMVNDNMAQLQQQFQQDYAAKLADMQAMKPNQDDSASAVKLEKNDLEGAQPNKPVVNDKEEKDEKDEKDEKLEQAVIDDIFAYDLIQYPRQRPDDLIFCELHQAYLRDAEKTFRKTQALYLSGQLELESELEQLSRHIYMRLLKMIKVLYIHYYKLDIPNIQLERVRLLFIHRFDYMRTLKPSDPSYFDSNNNNSLYSLLDDACNNLNNYYLHDKPIIPVSFTANKIYCDFFKDETKIAKNLQTPKHDQDALGILMQMIATLEELKYKTNDEIMLYHFESDARNQDELHNLMLYLGFLVRQLREQHYGFCQNALNIQLSFVAYRISLINRLQKMVPFHIEAKKSSKGSDYHVLLPFLLEIHKQPKNEFKEILQLLDPNEMLLLCIEFRNIISHKSIEKSRVLEALSSQFYLTVIRHLTQNLLPSLHDMVNQLQPAQDNNNNNAKPAPFLLFTSENASTSQSNPSVSSSSTASVFIPKPPSSSIFDKR